MLGPAFQPVGRVDIKVGWRLLLKLPTKDVYRRCHEIPTLPIIRPFKLIEVDVGVEFGEFHEQR